ncbi:conjugative transposon protein TraN [Chitinophaga barathri]|uniref:Conjugative transposon protein TraN n=1 Tax=Chitinophaga barathri TaxID=1647451 RepID=A0A3N4M7V6_9BACT|nr:conjugative transposon protein TraN [Chitinophaga barathri]RPD39345.1 conjugative transposon protein TraN [Chitinophaga barathri]
MKRISVLSVMCVFMLTSWLSGYCQQDATFIKSTISPLRLTVSKFKTTNLIFPFSIISVDRGSGQLLVQKATGVQNILQVKAASDSLMETNLTVVTSDGRLYSFVTSYGNEPSVLNVNLGTSMPEGEPFAGMLSKSIQDEAMIQNSAMRVSALKPLFRHVSDRKHDISFGMTGIYIHEDICFWQLQLTNSSRIKYDVQQLRFFIKDLRRSKRTASQEVEILPTYAIGNKSSVYPNSSQTAVIALPKFVIPENKVLVIQLIEKSGGRNLTLEVKNKYILQARPI